MDLFAAVLYEKPIPNRHRGATIIIKRQVISEVAGPCRHVYDSLLTHSTPMPYTGSYLAGTLASCHCHQRILLPHHQCWMKSKLKTLGSSWFETQRFTLWWCFSAVWHSSGWATTFELWSSLIINLFHQGHRFLIGDIALVSKW